MFARVPVLSLVVISLIPAPTAGTWQSRYTLDADGAVQLAVESSDARYGLARPGVNGAPFFSLALGASSRGALLLSRATPEQPEPGRYDVRRWEDRDARNTNFQALFVAGSPEQPVGVFHGEAGWVSIESSGQGQLAGSFEIRARGFLAASLEEEDRWVTVRGTFVIKNDTASTTVQSVRGSSTP